MPNDFLETSINDLVGSKPAENKIVPGKINAPGSNLPPFDIKLNAGEDPLNKAKEITGTSDFLEQSINDLGITNIKDVPIKPIQKHINTNVYGIDKIVDQVFSGGRGNNTPSKIPTITPDESSSVMTALNKVWGLATHPYDIVKGSTEFIASLPGFGEGMIGAAWEISKALGKGANLSEVYDAASKGMEENMTSWNNAVVGPLGRLLDIPYKLADKAADKYLGIKPREEDYSSAVSDIAMAPLNLVTKATHDLADSHAYDDYPTIRGAIKFGGDVLGLLTIGRIYQGGAAEYAKDVKPIIEKADAINKRQKVVSEIPDEVLRTAQEKVLEVEKTQLELEAKLLQDKLDHTKIIEEDLKAKGQEVQDIKNGKKSFFEDPFHNQTELDLIDAKGREEGLAEYNKMREEDFTRRSKGVYKEKVKEEPIDMLEKSIEDVQLKEIAEEAKPNELQKEKKEKKVESKTPELDELTRIGKTVEETITELQAGIDDPKQIRWHKTYQKKIDAINKEIKYTEKKAKTKKVAAEPITDLDLQTGTPLPEELSTHNHPFRDKRVEHTNSMSKIFQERIGKTDTSPEVFTRYLINEVNRYLNGEEVNIEKVRNGLSDLAINADKARLIFENKEDFYAWKSIAQDAAQWARGADRLTNKRTGGTNLNMMIPINEAPKIVKDLLKNIKGSADLFRNKEVFDKTGYWLAKDGKWRYEVDDTKNQLRQGTIDHAKKLGALSEGKLPAFINNPELFKAVPELDNIRVVIGHNNLKGEDYGHYEPLTKNIIIGKKNIQSTFIHELQHAVNDIMSSRFKGSNPGAEQRSMIIDLLNTIKHTVTDGDVKIEATNILYKLDKESINTTRVVNDLKNIAKDEKDKSSIDKAFNDYLSSDAYENYMKDPGEMEARLASKRMEMTPEQRKSEPPWETLEKMLEDEGERGALGTSEYPKSFTPYGIKLYMGLDPTQIKRFFKGFHGTSSKYIKPEEMVGKYLEPKSLEGIVEDVLDEIGLKGNDRNTVREQIYKDEYFDMAIDPIKYEIDPEGTRKFKDKQLFVAKEFDDAAEYAQWAGEAYDAALSTITVSEEIPESIKNKAQSIFDKNKEATPYVLELNYNEPLKEGDNVSSTPLQVTGVYDTNGIKLYSGVDVSEATKKIIAGAKALANYTAKARGMKEWKPGVAAESIKEELVRSFVDRSGNIRRELLDKLGQDGYEIIQKMYLSKGASSLAAQQLKQMRSEVYDGLTKNERRILDNLILADRMLDIGKYKTASQFKFPEGLSPVESAAYNELFQFTEKITSEKADLLKQRAQAYFEWMKKPLKDMLDADLIDQAEYDALASHNYRRLKLVDVFDKRYQSKVGKTKRTVYDSGVESLAHGRETDVFEPSSEVMALEVFNRAYGRILNNAANKTLLDLARTQKDNPFVAVKELTTDHVPSGWDRIFVYERGERKALYLSPEMSKEWITNSPEMSYKMSQFIRYASGSPVLRTFATGIDWGFALANLPRDIMHIWYASRVFEGGKWKPLYNSNMPVYAGQMGADIAGVFHDAVMRKGKYLDYIKEGGGMEFLVHQGRLMQRGRHIEGGIDNVQNFLGYFGETSEIMTRLAVRDRVIKRRASEQGISYEEAAKDKKITQEATFAARDYMDFGQGGGIGKALDNGLPYLNASIQGTRGMFRSFKDNPIQSTYKLSQFAALVTGLYIANQALNPETLKALKGDIAMQGNLVIPLGDGLGFDDEKGQRRYPYIKIPLDPGQKFFKMFFEASYDKATGQPVDAEGVANSLSQISPVAISSLPPTVSGTLGYMYNKDFWKNDDIWKKTDKPLGWPESKEEYIPGQTPQALIDIGSVTGLSPERLKYTLSELVTGGSMWSWLVGQGYDAAFHGLPQNKKEMHLAEVLSKTPIAKRFIGITNPYTQYASSIEQAREESMLKRWVENRGLDQRVESFLYEGGKRSDVTDYIRATSKDQATEDRLKDRFIFQEKIKELPNRSFWLSLKGTPDTDARAKLYVQRLESATPEEKEQLRKEEAIVYNAGGVISDEFKEAVMKIRYKK